MNFKKKILRKEKMFWMKNQKKTKNNEIDSMSDGRPSGSKNVEPEGIHLDRNVPRSTLARKKNEKINTTTACHQVFLVERHSPRLLPSFTGFYRVLLRFTGFFSAQNLS